ncbi:MAG: Spy/CpxP family protein refolding chaperone [Fimbriimonadaceae bacterium]|nr:Spy/CpxP family protein refolding chaperone [Fimbriimonadaceae bacterium]
MALVVGMGLLGIGEQSTPISAKNEPIKALTETDMTGLLEGRGMGMAKVAELNSYPGPMHVLDLKQELNLTSTQEKKLTSMMKSMRDRAKALGKQIVTQEKLLDIEFRNAKVIPSKVSESLEQIGSLYGQLRWAHVKAHIETRAVLTRDQVALYDKLRGYSKDKP